MAAYVPPAGGAIRTTNRHPYSAPAGADVRVTLFPPDTGVAKRVYKSMRSVSGLGQPADETPSAAWGRSPSHDVSPTLRWVIPPRTDHGLGAGWQRTDGCDRSGGSRWTITVARHRETVGGWARLDRADGSHRAPWQGTIACDGLLLASAWQRVDATDTRQVVVWEKAGRPVALYAPPVEAEYVPPLGTAVLVSMSPGYVPPRNDAVDFLLARLGGGLPIVVYESDPVPMGVPWGRNIALGPIDVIRWGHGPQLGPRDPPPYEFPNGSTHEPPPIPPTSEVYVIMNEVQVVLLPDRTPIAVNALEVATSVDAWCWSVNMELADPSQLALLKPTAGGPKVVEITMNTYQWTAIIEGRDAARTHASTGGRNASVTGRSQTALLSDAYVARRTLAMDETRTAQQLALGEITDRVLPFNIEWDGVDWLVPGGVWTYQDLAPIDAISQIAAARGAVVQSAPADGRLLVRARYPSSPWTWLAETADIALPIDWVTSESAQQQSKPLYDAVFVVGQQQGVLARITRQGSAGETFAPQVVDGLIVTPDVAAERGRNILSDRGMQDLVTLEIPLFAPGTATAGATGLYVPLMVVDVLDPDDRYQALSVGVSISARRSGDAESAMEIWQTVSLERHLSDAH